MHLLNGIFGPFSVTNMFDIFYFLLIEYIIFLRHPRKQYAMPLETTGFQLIKPREFDSQNAETDVVRNRMVKARETLPKK